MPVSESEVAARATRVGIGHVRIGGAEDSLRATLGSCVGACLVWPLEGRFGLVHVLLPQPLDGDEVEESKRSRYAETAIPLMLELMDVPQERRREVVAYVAGGARMFSGKEQQTHVGDDNQAALVEALRRHRIRVKGTDFGGEEGRQLVVHGPSQTVFSLHLEDDQVVRWEMPRNFNSGVRPKQRTEESQ